MTEGRPPRGGPRPRPKGFDDVPVLSDEEVERRVDVRGGGAPRAPIERTPRVTRPPRRAQRTTARDSLLLIGLVIIGLVAVRVFLPDGPLTASATSSPSGTQAAVVTTAPSAASTPGLETLVPVITLPPGTPEPTDIVEPTAEPTVPGPTPTLKPGETPKPTPKVTPRPTAAPTPGHTAVPTPGPTAPNRATVVVTMVVVKDSGGSSSADPSDWTIHVGGAAGGSASQNDVAGSGSGTTITIPALQGYTITSNDARSDFAAYPIDAECSNSAGLAASTPTTYCTITRDDRPRIRVITNVNGGGPSSASDVTVTVTGGEAQPPSFAGTESGQVVVVGFGLTYSISMSNLADYDKSGPSGDCSGSLSLDAPQTTCTYTYDYVPPPSPTLLLPPMILPFLRPRRWRTTATG